MTQEQKIDLKKDIFNKDQYLRVIDTDFNELGVTTIQEDLEEQTSIEDFFNLYNELFYDIPPTGESNSHEFIVQQSGNYINFEDNLEEIEVLRNEITQLRRELLSLQVRNTELETGQTLNVNTGSLDESQANIENIFNDITQEQQSNPTISSNSSGASTSNVSNSGGSSY